MGKNLKVAKVNYKSGKSLLHLQNRMVLYTTHTAPRVIYMAEWLGLYLYGEPLKIITNKDDLLEKDIILNYSNDTIYVANFWIKPHSLLFENNIQQQITLVKRKNNLPYFFETEGDFHFDILAASFFLIQRYEEYLPYEKDKYGRYAYKNSLAFRENFLHLPLVDLWILEFKKTIQQKYIDYQNFTIHQFCFLPTYDIDVAYSYKGRGFFRNTARSLKSLRKWTLIKESAYVFFRKQPDTFDIYEELDILHKSYNLKPIYFFLLAQQLGKHDKNINPSKSSIKNLIHDICKKYEIGIHPSWQSGDSESLVKEETETIRMISKQNVSISRQHYIRMSMPHTFQLLIKHGITSEHSMGYATINGFRASTCRPYYWYDLQKETSTLLNIFPFCYMDATSICRHKISTEEALEELKYYHDTVKQVEGTFITIFHNHSIGFDEEGRKWMKFYKDFFSLSRNLLKPISPNQLP